MIAFKQSLLMVLLVAGGFLSARTVVPSLDSRYYVHPFGYSPQDLIHNFVEDVIETTVNVASEESMAALSLFVPLYIGGRLVDDEVHATFYDEEYHRNLDEPGNWAKNCSGFSLGSLFFPAYILGGMTQFSSDENTRMTGSAIFSGIVVALLVKEVLKQFKMGVRPRNQHYSRHRRIYNGFPSGHMVGASYLATLFTMRLGLQWGAPMIIGALICGGMTVHCNTHYVSQVVAGAAIGAMVAGSSSRVIDRRIKKVVRRCALRPGISPRQEPCLKFTYSF